MPPRSTSNVQANRIPSDSRSTPELVVCNPPATQIRAFGWHRLGLNCHREVGGLTVGAGFKFVQALPEDRLGVALGAVGGLVLPQALALRVAPELSGGLTALAVLLAVDSGTPCARVPDRSAVWRGPWAKGFLRRLSRSPYECRAYAGTTDVYRRPGMAG